jgi:WD40 repeat protein
LERGWRWCRRNKLVASLAGTIALVLLAGTAVSTHFAIQAGRGEKRAMDEKYLADHRFYDAEINLSQHEWERGLIGQVRERLAKLRPQRPEDSDLRGFEWYHLERLCRLDLRTLHGHTERVKSVAFSPDGRQLAAAGGGEEDGKIIVWDAATGAEIRTRFAGTEAIDSVAFSPDGCRLAAACGTSVRFWTARNGRELPPWHGPEGKIGRVAFSLDGRWLAAASSQPPGEGSDITIWNAVTGQPALTFHGHWRTAFSMAISPDGRRLAWADDNKTVKLFDLKTASKILTFDGQYDSPPRLAFSRDGHYLACATGRGREVLIWDADSGRLLNSLRGHTDYVTDVTFSPDGRRLASASRDHTVKIWDAASGQEELTLRGHLDTVNTVAFSPSGLRLASGSEDQTVKVWDASAGHEVLALGQHGGCAYGAAFSPDGHYLASAGDDGTVKLWDTSTGSVLQIMPGHAEAVYCVAFAPNGQILASAGPDHTIKLWDTASGRERQTLRGHKDDVIRLAISPDGSLLASASADATVRLWDLASGQELRTLQGHTGTVCAVAFSTDSRRLASAGGQVRNSAGPKFDEARRSGEVKIWDITTGRELSSLRGHSSQVRSVAFSPDGRTLASAGLDKTIRIWDLDTHQELAEMRGQGQQIWSVAYSPDGRRLVSGGGGTAGSGATAGEVKLWDVATGQQVLSLPTHSERVWRAIFSPDGQRLAAACDDGTLKIWDATPLTPELLTLREARSVVQNLFARPLPRNDVLESLRSDLTLNEAVRRQALALALQRSDDAPLLDEAARSVVGLPGAGANKYWLALRQAETACQAAPNRSRYQTTLGMAQYRLGKFKESLATLGNADQLNRTEAKKPDPANLAFLAMVRHRLGQNEQARAEYEKLRETLKQPSASRNQEGQTLLREVELTLGGTLKNGKP